MKVGRNSTSNPIDSVLFYVTVVLNFYHGISFLRGLSLIILKVVKYLRNRKLKILLHSSNESIMCPRVRFHLDTSPLSYLCPILIVTAISAFKSQFVLYFYVLEDDILPESHVDSWLIWNLCIVLNKMM